jgi:hypothetical protein
MILLVLICLGFSGNLIPADPDIRIMNELEEYANNNVKPMIKRDQNGKLHLLFSATGLPETFRQQIRYCQQADDRFGCIVKDSVGFINSDAQMLISASGYVFIIYGYHDYYVLSINPEGQYLAHTKLKFKARLNSATVLNSNALFLTTGGDTSYFIIFKQSGINRVSNVNYFSISNIERIYD